MFGYVIPDKDNMLIKDYALYGAYYCGLCKALSKTGSQLTRLCTNYDTTFYNVLLHALSNQEVTVYQKRCMYEFEKKNFIEMDEMTKKVADLSVLLVYYNIDDDIHDGKPLRAPANWALYQRKRKAKKNMPKIDKLMKDSFSTLAKLEKEKCESIDRVADTFASLMRDITKEFVQTNSIIDTFTYNLGRIVYLMDAIDDVEKDTKDKRYNVITLNLGECKDKKEYMQKNAQELQFMLYSSYNLLVQSYNQMRIKVGEPVLSNVIYLGLKKQIDQILQGEKRCQLTHI